MECRANEEDSVKKSPVFPLLYCTIYYMCTASPNPVCCWFYNCITFIIPYVLLALHAAYLISIDKRSSETCSQSNMAGKSTVQIVFHVFLFNNKDFPSGHIDYQKAYPVHTLRRTAPHNKTLQASINVLTFPSLLIFDCSLQACFWHGLRNKHQ